MKLTLELDPLNEKEVEEAHAILTILGGGGTTVTGTPTPVNVSNITQTPEDRKDPAAEKAAADKAAADKKAADDKAKADKAAADKKAADAKAAADKKAADDKAAADAKAAEEAKAAETTTTDAPADDDDFLDGPADDAKVYTIEDVRGALKAYAAKHTKEKAVQILKDNGASTIGDLAADKYAIVMATASVED